MTDWVDIANSAIAPKAPVTSELMTALRDNTVVTMWEDVVTFYDYSIDGAVLSATTPDFEDGWDYGITFEGLTATTVIYANITLNLVDSTTATVIARDHYDPTGTSNIFYVTTSAALTGGFWVGDCRWNRPVTCAITLHMDLGLGTDSTGLSKAAGGLSATPNPAATDTRVKSITVGFPSGSGQTFTSGTMTLRRKRNETYA